MWVSFLGRILCKAEWLIELMGFNILELLSFVVDRAGLEPTPTVNCDQYSVGVGSKPIRDF